VNVVEVRDILKWGSGRLCGYRRVSLGFATTVFTLTADFLLGFTVTDLEATVGLGSDFIGLVVFVEAVTFGYLGTSVAGRALGFEYEE
jgi:hypothetical protein